MKATGWGRRDDEGMTWGTNGQKGRRKMMGKATPIGSAHLSVREGEGGATVGWCAGVGHVQVVQRGGEWAGSKRLSAQSKNRIFK